MAQKTGKRNRGNRIENLKRKEEKGKVGKTKIKKIKVPPSREENEHPNAYAHRLGLNVYD